MVSHCLPAKEEVQKLRLNGKKETGSGNKPNESHSLQQRAQEQKVTKSPAGRGSGFAACLTRGIKIHLPRSKNMLFFYGLIKELEQMMECAQKLIAAI